MTNMIRLVAISINDGLKIAASYSAILWALDGYIGWRRKFTNLIDKTV